MNSIYINYDDLDKLKKMRTTLSSESKLYIKDDLLYKILLDNHRNEKRKRNIELLSKYNHPNCVFPKDIILNEKTNEFIGLTIDYLKDYKTLYKSIKTDKMSFERRKHIAIKICEIQSHLEKEKISFVDIHSNNIMIKDNDIKLIDLDSASFFEENLSPVYEHLRQDIISDRLSKLFFSLLYGKELKYEEIDEERINKLLKYSTKKQQELIEKVFLFKSTIIDPREYMEDFDEQDMEVCRLILRR